MIEEDNKLKKIIYFLGILSLTIIILLNILFTAKMDYFEHITIQFNNCLYIIGLIIIGSFLFFITKIINEYLYKDTNSKSKATNRKYLFLGSLIIYIVFNIIWITLVNPNIGGDQIHVSNLAQAIFRGNVEEILPSLTYAGISLGDYIQAYQQQIPLAFIFNIFFRIIHTDTLQTLRILNIIGNILIVIALYKINNQLSKKYKTNKVLLLTLILTFISLPMLLTFVYGDIPSLALCLFAVYFMMRYTETKKYIYPIFASVFTMVAYMMRMNSLIFIIATVIYLLLNLLKRFTKKSWKNRLLETCIIIIYITISIVPTTLVKNYYLNKFNLDKNNSYPNVSFILLAMEEGPRANGWYNEEIGEKALNKLGGIKDEYKERIMQRLKYFTENIGYTFDFYIMKLASMWTENTYSAINNNGLTDENLINLLTFYQKVLLLLMCICSIIVLVQNRKNLSIDIIFLITIFIGGFAFHILWEAKSRYIIPYIIVLIPIASISIRNTYIRKKLTEGKGEGKLDV